MPAQSASFVQPKNRQRRTVGYMTMPAILRRPRLCCSLLVLMIQSAGAQPWGVGHVVTVSPLDERVKAAAPTSIRMPFRAGEAWGVSQGWCNRCPGPECPACCENHKLDALTYGIDFNLPGVEDIRRHVLV